MPALRSVVADRGRLTVVALSALLCLVVVIEAPGAMLDLARRTRNAHATDLQSKLLMGASGPGISTTYMAATRRLVPLGATYAVVTGSAAKAPTPVTLPWVTTFSRYWLFPREQVPVRRADWILCYGCQRDSLRPGDVAYEEEGGALAILRARS